MSSICGGVISETQHQKNIAKHGVWADTMSYVMPDKAYNKYIKEKDAKKRESIFRNFAVSQI